MKRECMYACTDYDLLIMYKCVKFCEINIHSFITYHPHNPHEHIPQHSVYHTQVEATALFMADQFFMRENLAYVYLIHDYLTQSI